MRIAAHLLHWLLDRTDGDVDRALAMYLQGVYGVERGGVSSAGRAYAARVATFRRMFR